MSHRDDFDRMFARCPLVAILRGVRPDEVEGIGHALVDAGFTLIEVPLNSPDPFESIARLSRAVAGRAVVGAGTVLRPEDVARVETAGGTLIIAPNTDAPVIAEAARRSLVPIPGFTTPSEAFVALDAGAAALKLFPAELASPTVLKAFRAVLPQDLKVLPVGGITPERIADWHTAGANGFGLGSALYKPGLSPEAVRSKAIEFVRALPAPQH